MITKCNSGVPDRLDFSPAPGTRACLPPLLKGRDRVSRVRNPNNVGEGCNLTSEKPQRWVPIHHFHSPKKGRGTPTYNQYKTGESIHPSSPFQDGGNPHVKRPLDTRGLHGKYRLEGHLFCGANKRTRQEIPEVQVERHSVSVQLPTFWTVMCSLGLYQYNQGSNCSAKGNEHQNNILYRRYAHHGRIGDSSARPCSSNLIPPGEPRVHHKIPEVNSGTKDNPQVPRFPSRLLFHGAQAPSKQTEEYISKARQGGSLPPVTPLH